MTKNPQTLPRVSIPVTPEFYHQFRLIAAENGQGIAAFGRDALERVVTRHVRKNSIVIERLETE